ncbi:cyclopropane-fatty-acyl-phospholipid synthase family protein [Phenylobacterium sp. RIFCSPHIGHO2_01_FULL_69_31]|uniref:SAM-dependent methyltransferase n=1 Tax=Phenylobacterium sp. RIFCSPHIGHO2_01_FULL_69_31 TaxID=1801944 RepID=UPI000B02F224|nr:cyclopropane-fatty-acyl-phospholipid synthase family protein [Phenylobacterium sp. RIFCSPHIGHO2_01_FULL_69_31]
MTDLSGTPLVFRAAARTIIRNWNTGVMTFVLPDGREIRLEGREPGLEARLVVRDYDFIKRTISNGTIGFGEGYMAGEWDTPDLSVLLEVLAQNYARFEKVSFGSRFMAALNVIEHALGRNNSRSGSKKNIQAHYDLGNAFYSRWLDTTMTYSAARFERPGEALSDAQKRKYRTLCESMGLAPEHHVLEIGCGWGGFAEFAAKDVGAKVTAITISEEQFKFAKERMFRQGLNEKAEIQLVDYRDVAGRFDRVASIEMFEAVGERYWPTYFDKVRDSLKPGGQAGLQIITIRDEYFEHYRRTPDFIQKYIFPGGMLPSEERLRAATDRAGLAWGPISRFGVCYADTLAEWGRRFEAAWDEITRLGFDERFRKLWRFYLSYCEAGFRTERTDVVQLSLIKA